MEDPLDFNIVLGHDHVYAMNVVVSTLFHVMYFPRNENIITINQLEFVDTYHYPNLDQVYPLSILSVSVDIPLPRVNYVASHPSCPIVIEKNPLHSCLSSWYLVSTIDQVIDSMGALEFALHPIDQIECLDRSSI